MSDDDKQPELTPKEQRAQDQQRVQNQLIVTDVNRQVQDVMDLFPFGGSGNSGRTSFEGFDLNAMIDLIENSNPEHLEHAGEALLTARRAIAKAANELGDFIKDVDWEGESGTAFRDWGTGLVAHALKLGDFAETTGIQITVAGTGLASVRKSLPPRDGRLVRKSVDEIETPKRVEGNPEYAAALKVEKDRQEAINQANRLASYYAVSEETLAAQAPPRFEKKLDVAMPKPDGLFLPGSNSEGSSAGSESLGVSSTQGHSERAATADAGTPGVTSNRAAIEALGTAPTPDTSTSTEIDSVKAPPAPVTVPDTSPAPPTANPTGPSTGPNPPVVNEFVNPVAGGSRRSTPPTGLPRTIGQPGRSGPTSNGPTATGRTGVPVGRPAPIGGGPGSGTPGRPGGGGSQPPAAGRTSVTGGRPMTGGPANTSKSPGPRTGRARAIVGGTPQRTAPGTDSAGGTRGVPRGTVIGAGGTNAAPRPGGRGTPSSKGVVGTPRSAAGSGSGARGFTAGGAGLVRGPAGRRDSNDEDQDGGAARLDYLVEDRETWEAGRRGAAPPVIE
ncbi:hypothetical protein OG195_12075 [Streptomyces sp. NBC_01362]|uniref:hypothetical protein n=1 Tax=Streptomyces sp. NBC_01362 TaxID=2903839 RepID=UPI002E371B21|nr:hypothetical protein [Streptomyces sp. NBC_01362]